MKSEKKETYVKIWIVLMFFVGLTVGLWVSTGMHQPLINDWKRVAIKGAINNHLCTEVLTGEPKPIIKDIGDIFCKIRHGQDAVYHFENEIHVCYYGLERSEII